MVSVSSYASLSQEHLPPHDTINAIVRSADGSHGIVELTWGAPVESRLKLAHSGVTVTGTEGWVSIDNAKNAEGKNVLVVATRVRVKDAQGRPVGETEEIVKKEVSGVKEEFRRFFNAVNGKDDGFGKPIDALKDVAFIQAALNSNGAPVDLVSLAKSG